MLIEFRVKNFRSIRDELVLNLVASRDDSLEDNCISSHGLSLLKSTAIYGANASGKSNLVSAVQFMRSFVWNSADTQVGDSIPVKPFLLDELSSSSPSLFEITFLVEGVRYQYGFEVNKERVLTEWLFASPLGRAQRWFEREYDEEQGVYEWKFGSNLKGEKNRIRELTRGNALFLSVAAKFAHSQLTPIYTWFRKHLQVAPPKHLFGPITAKALLESESDDEVKTTLYEYAIDFLKKADLGIAGVKISKEDVGEQVPDNLPEEIRSVLLQKLTDVSGFKIHLAHHNSDTGEDVFIDLEEESDGTQRLFQLAIPWLQAVTLGITIIVDELESSLHPLLSRALIEFIQGPANESGAQIVFTTHDSTLLDQSLLRRDQVWMMEKDPQGGSHMYSLLEFKPRKGEALQKGYLAGRYGGIPALEDFSSK